MKILLNILTHGDETIGLKVAEEIGRLNLNKEDVFIHEANRKAYDLGKRFVDQDLNRSFPGKAIGNHEERLAFEISPLVKGADIVLDIHSTISTLKDALIVTKLDKKTCEYIKAIHPKYVVMFKNGIKDKVLISSAKVGFVFEYGNNDDSETVKKIVTDIKRLLSYLNIISEKFSEKNFEISYFEVFSEASKPSGFRLASDVDNYKLVKKGETFALKGEKSIKAEEDFYPILFGNSNYDEIFGFKSRKIIPEL